MTDEMIKVVRKSVQESIFSLTDEQRFNLKMKPLIDLLSDQ